MPADLTFDRVLVPNFDMMNVLPRTMINDFDIRNSTVVENVFNDIRCLNDSDFQVQKRLRREQEIVSSSQLFDFQMNEVGTSARGSDF